MRLLSKSQVHPTPGRPLTPPTPTKSAIKKKIRPLNIQRRSPSSSVVRAEMETAPGFEVDSDELGGTCLDVMYTGRLASPSGTKFVSHSGVVIAREGENGLNDYKVMHRDRLTLIGINLCSNLICKSLHIFYFILRIAVNDKLHGSRKYQYYLVCFDSLFLTIEDTDLTFTVPPERITSFVLGYLC
ncbi:hypothetical protein K439DRAFT_558349 [Ramaria rubella]|nr:hypothetical protein K439DRAFT_558349 [Ramaria rubella]